MKPSPDHHFGEEYRRCVADVLWSRVGSDMQALRGFFRAALRDGHSPEDIYRSARHATRSPDAAVIICAAMRQENEGYFRNIIERIEETHRFHPGNGEPRAAE